VARRDLLRVRTNMMRHEREREALIRVFPGLRNLSEAPGDQRRAQSRHGG
jgi:hypothetical protein